MSQRRSRTFTLKAWMDVELVRLADVEETVTISKWIGTMTVRTPSEPEAFERASIASSSRRSTPSFFGYLHSGKRLHQEDKVVERHMLLHRIFPGSPSIHRPTSTPGTLSKGNGKSLERAPKSAEWMSLPVDVVSCHLSGASSNA